MHKRGIIVLGCVFLMFLAQSFQARVINKHVHKRFPVNESTTLFLQHGNASVNIIPWEKNSIDIHVRYRSCSLFPDAGNINDLAVEFTSTRQKISVIGKLQNNSSPDYLPLIKFDCEYTVYAPAWIKLCLSGGDGNVHVKDWEAEIAYILEDEEIGIDQCDERTKLFISRGELRIDGLYGYLLVESANGSIVLSSCQTPVCRIQMRDGNIFISRSQTNTSLPGAATMPDLKQIESAERNYYTSEEVEIRNPSVIQLEFCDRDGDICVELEYEVSTILSINSNQNSICLSILNPEKFSDSWHRISGHVFDGKSEIRISSHEDKVTLRGT
ncbi:hypothetical protein GF407_05405 [candidate division KSB1 bacterium]|nr:hypothetical protein [candidate division KSB1 bacterium]